MFNNKELNEVHRINSDEILKHIKFLNDLSSDIKKLENILNDAGFYYAIRTQMDDNSYIFWDGSRIRFYSKEIARPLIETPVEIRIKCSKMLPDFFQSAMNLLKGDK